MCADIPKRRRFAAINVISSLSIYPRCASTSELTQGKSHTNAVNVPKGLANRGILSVTCSYTTSMPQIKIFRLRFTTITAHLQPHISCKQFSLNHSNLARVPRQFIKSLVGFNPLTSQTIIV